MVNKKSISLLVIVGVTIFIVSSIAKKISTEGIVINNLLDYVFAFLKYHLWETISIGSMALGIWFSIVRRRVIISILFLLVAFLSSFVFPLIHI